jgi:hypothetical protein
MIPALHRFAPLTRLAMKRRERADARSLRERCEAILRDLFIPNPFDEQAFCAALAVRRGRPIVLQSLPLRVMTTRSVIYGLVISTPARDIIIYERDTSRAHQRQIIVHEACHLIFNHRSTPLPGHVLSEPSEVIEGTGASCPALGKPGYTEAEDHEAEVLASLILEQVAISAPSGGSDPDVEATATVVRLAAFYRLKGGV